MLPANYEIAIVYVLSRKDGASSNFSKVGFTKGSATERARNYTDGGWSVFYEQEVPLPLSGFVEARAHEILRSAGHWFDPSMTGGTAMEVFTCSPKCAKEAVIQAYGQSIVGMAEYIALETNYLKKQLDCERDSEIKDRKTIIENQKKEIDNLTTIIKNLNIDIMNLNNNVTELKKALKDKEKLSLENDRKAKELDFYRENDMIKRRVDRNLRKA